MSNYPDLCDRCGKESDLAAYPMLYGEDWYVCPECFGELEVEAEGNWERWKENQEEAKP